MPLSDHEQRILAELEESLNREDPEFADKVRNDTLYRHSGRQARWAALAFVVGLVLTVWLFTTSLWLALVGVAIMFVAAVVIQRNLRRMGRAGLHDLRRGLDGAEPSGAERGVHEARDWFKKRFSRDVD